MLASELFGHEAGAFTDARTAKPGLFELADGGTLFLDEIGHLPIVLQGKLLRVLEERTVRRVGGTRSIAFVIRIIVATRVDLPSEIARGEFREDLWYRLNVLPIELPALRDRGVDVRELAEAFITRFAGEYRDRSSSDAGDGGRARADGARRAHPCDTRATDRASYSGLRRWPSWRGTPRARW